MLNNFQPAAPFAFGTKGETLARLAPLLGKQYFVDQTLFTVADWRTGQSRLVAGILNSHGGHRYLVVRSSARGEDGVESSMAGAYTTVVSVLPEPAAVAAAVDGVIESYGDDNGDHHVLVQPMIEDVVISGVVLTRELDTGSPYYVVNYDDVTGRTDGVTGGHRENKCILVRRDHVDGLRSPRFQGLLRLIREIEAIVESDELDIEFCITANGQIYILQVRLLAAKRNWLPLNSEAVQGAVEQCKVAIGEHFQPRVGLFGKTTLFGEMPDWNPAEMIGNCPKPLALSLYCHLITDASWSTARRNMGYRVLPSDPLLVSFAGRPYIDVRLSLNSFLPEGLDPVFAEQLVDWQLERLAANPEWHDKIEFAIAATCRDLAFSDYAGKLVEAGFNAGQVSRFGDALGALTKRCVVDGDRSLQALYERTRRLNMVAHAGSGGDARQRALALVASCIDGGIIPFAELARHAFIGVAFLKSAVSRGALSADDVDALLKGVNTVAGEFAQDMYQLSQGRLPQEVFLDRYGHLRPGTYDITSWRYDEHPELYLAGHCAEPPAHPFYHYSAAQRRDLDRLLVEEGYAFGLDALNTYITQAVRLREAAKFEFTKHVSEALKLLAQWGDGIGLSREDIAHLTIGQISQSSDRAKLAEWIAVAQECYAVTRAIRLPHLIVSEIDVDVVRMPLGSPNFITNKRITAPVRRLHVNEVPDLDGEIVLIESADPGFDWIFSRPIGGLITKYGGANSHMAIRCAEFDLPAAIGCGERMFDMVAHEHKVELNCAARTIRPAR